MREQKRKVRVPVMGDLPATWCDEVAEDILELWIGISRLMARVHGPDRPFQAAIGAAPRPPAKKSSAVRRAPRRKAA